MTEMCLWAIGSAMRWWSTLERSWRIQEPSKFLTGLERGNSLRRNLHRFAGARVSRLSSFAFPNFERSKAANFELATILQGIGDSTQKRADYLLCIRLAHGGGTHDVIDEMGFGHALQYGATTLLKNVSNA
jgi:hypothetical protein